MDKERTIAWLKANSEKPDQEIEAFLKSEIAKDTTSESWQKYYFLEDLQWPGNEFSKKILRQIKSVQKSTRTKGSWFSGYLVAGFLYALAQSFNKNSIDGLIIGIIAIAAGVLYHRVRRWIGIRNQAGNIIVTIVILYIASAFLIGFLTALASNWQAIAVRTPAGSGIVSSDAATMKQIEATMQANLNSSQNQSAEYEKDIDDQTASVSVYQSNIKDYQAIEKLNDEEYADAESGFTQLSKTFEKYSLSLSSSITDLVSAVKNSTDAKDAVYEAEITYYKSLINDESEATIEVNRQAVNDAIDNLNKVQQETVQAQQNYQDALNKFSAS